MGHGYQWWTERPEAGARVGRFYAVAAFAFLMPARVNP